METWLSAVGEQYGRIDVLYAGAGATGFNALDDVSVEDGAFVLRNELDVVFYPAKHAWAAPK